jgi:hypothetical protein
MMEAARISETLGNFYQTTRLYNPEEIHLRTHRRENLKSYYVFKKVTSVYLWLCGIWLFIYLCSLPTRDLISTLNITCWPK